MEHLWIMIKEKKNLSPEDAQTRRTKKIIYASAAAMTAITLTLTSSSDMNFGPIWMQRLGANLGARICKRDGCVVAWERKAEWHQRLGESQHAIASYSKALSLSYRQADPNILYKRATLFTALQDYAKANQDFLKYEESLNIRVKLGKQERRQLKRAQETRKILESLLNGDTSNITESQLKSMLAIFNASSLPSKDLLEGYSLIRDIRPMFLSQDYYGWMSNQRYKQGQSAEACKDARIGAQMGHPKLKAWLKSDYAKSYCHQ